MENVIQPNDLEVLKEFSQSLNQFANQLETTSEQISKSKNFRSQISSSHEPKSKKKVDTLVDENKELKKTKTELTKEVNELKKGSENQKNKLNVAIQKCRMYETISYGIFFDDRGFRISVARGFDKPRTVPLSKMLYSEEITNNAQDTHNLASAILLSDNERVAMVGLKAFIKQKTIGRGNLIEHIENQISVEGDENIVTWREKRYDSIDLLAIIFKYLKKEADVYVSAPEGRVVGEEYSLQRRETLVISCPDDWSYLQRIRLSQAAQIAGFQSSIRVINNRMATALRWGFPNKPTKLGTKFFVLSAYGSKIDVSLMQYGKSDTGTNEIVTLGVRSETHIDSQTCLKLVQDILSQTQVPKQDVNVALLTGSNVDLNNFQETFLQFFGDAFKTQVIHRNNISQGALLYGQLGLWEFAKTGETPKKAGFIPLGRDILMRTLGLSVSIKDDNTNEVLKNELYELVQAGEQESKESISVNLPFYLGVNQSLVLKVFESKSALSEISYTSWVDHAIKFSTDLGLDKNQDFGIVGEASFSPDPDSAANDEYRVRIKRANFIYGVMIGRKVLKPCGLEPSLLSDYKDRTSLRVATERFKEIEVIG